MSEQFHMTFDEFVAALRETWADVHADTSTIKWHPEDLALNVGEMARTSGMFMASVIRVRRNQ